MTNREKMDILYNFDEGCELTDAVHGMLHAANTLYGINCDIEADMLVCVVLRLVTDHCVWVRDNGEQYELDELDNQVYILCMGCDKTLPF